MLETVHNYGPFKLGYEYRLIKEGYDWYLFAIGGKAIYAPKWVFEE